MKIIEVKDLSKRYIISKEMRLLVKDLLLFWKRKKTEELWALKDVNFAVDEGETVGIIGENGAGKSTILKILNGVTAATSGEIKTRGKISGVLELGIGFHPELTGRENLFLNAALLGLSRRYVQEKFDEIVEFSGLAEFIDAPIKKYSSGMLLRLAFSLSVNIDPDILLIDEVLAVGDESFQRKCTSKIKELKNQGKTIIFVSHDLSLVLSLSDWVILIRNGKIVKKSKPNEVIAFYLETVGEKKGIGLLQKPPLDIIFNNGKAKVFFRNRELTKDVGLYTTLYTNSRWHNSTEAEWTIERPSFNQLIAKGIFKKLSISQKWKFTVQNENEILFNIDTSSPIKIEQSAFNLILANNYTDYLTPNVKASFPEISQADKSWDEILQTTAAPKAVAIKDSQNIFPGLVLKPGDELTQPRLFNTDYQLNARVIQLINPDNSFSAKLLLDKKDTDKYMQSLGLIEEKKNRLCTIQKGPLKLIFENGKARIFFEDIELTKKMGLYTSLFSQFRWHHSTEASWGIRQESQDRLVLRGKLRRLPIFQNWEFKFLDSGISLAVDIEPYKEISIEQGRINLMLQQSYDNWFTRNAKGIFPEILFNEWADILDRDITDNYVGAECIQSSLQLPKITMELVYSLGNSLVRISNTDFHSNARVLQFLRLEPKNKLNFPPKNYRYMGAKLILNKV